MVSEQLTPKASNIIIIEDDNDIQLYVSTILECYGYSLFSAHSGSEALSLLDEVMPDLILLDIHLPDMNGLELLKSIRRNQSLKNIPVLAMTADASKETIDDAYELNIDDFIEKPINHSLLTKKIETALARKIANDDFLLQEKNLNKIQKIAGMGTWEYDSRYDDVTCSMEMDHILGINSDSMNFNLHSFLALTHENDIDDVSDVIHEAIKNNTPYALEHRIYDDDGY